MTAGATEETAGPALSNRKKSQLGYSSQFKYWATAILSPVAIVLVWDLITRVGLVRSVLLPSPGDIAQAFWAVLVGGYAGTSIFIHIGASLYRVLVAYLLAAVFGIVLGLLRGRYRLADATMLVPAEVVRPIPPLAFIPLFILWFGIGEVSKILIIAYYVMLIVMLNTQAGVRGCPADKIRAAQSLGAGPWQIFRYIIFPAALPQIMTGLRVGMAAALSILVAAELLGGDKGLGFVIMDASTFFRTKEVFVGIVLIGILGFISDRGLNYVSARFVHWEGKK
jgi:ABC-type nitrate/sulfonate/bicarbonate transport system permease component